MKKRDTCTYQYQQSKENESLWDRPPTPGSDITQTCDPPYIRGHGPECTCFRFLSTDICDHCRDWKEPTEPTLEIVLTRQVGWHTARGVRVVGENGLWHYYYRRMPRRLMARLTKAQKEAVEDWGRWGTNSQGLPEEDPDLT